MEELKINGNNLIKCLKKAKTGEIIEEVDGKNYVIFNEMIISVDGKRLIVEFHNKGICLAEASVDRMLSGDTLSLKAPEYLGRLNFNISS